MAANWFFIKFKFQSINRHALAEERPLFSFCRFYVFIQNKSSDRLAIQLHSHVCRYSLSHWLMFDDIKIYFIVSYPKAICVEYSNSTTKLMRSEQVERIEKKNKTKIRFQPALQIAAACGGGSDGCVLNDWICGAIVFERHKIKLLSCNLFGVISLNWGIFASCVLRACTTN